MLVKNAIFNPVVGKTLEHHQQVSFLYLAHVKVCSFRWHFKLKMSKGWKG